MTEIKAVEMDYLKQAIGTDGMPALSWVIQSDGVCVMQTAYQIQLSDTAKFQNVIYDSQKVISKESSGIKSCKKEDLHSCTRYWVRIKVWVKGTFQKENEEEESAFCKPVSFVTGLLDNEWQGDFVSAETKADKSNSKGTYLRKEFQIEKKVKEAYVCSTALGLYHLYLNGGQVGHDEMAPGWTSYHNHLCYQTYDVTDQLQIGENVIGAHIGAGWYKGLMGFIHERNNYGDQTALLLQLTIRYEDGTTQVLSTDESWIGANSPVIFSEIYDGEIYDARLEQSGWNVPGFVPKMDESFHHLTEEEKKSLMHDPLTQPFTEEEKKLQRQIAWTYQPSTTAWHTVEVVDFPKTVLTAQPGCRVSVEMELPAQQLFVTPKGEWVVDFGQNLTGCIRFRVKGRQGMKVRLRCFEVLDADGNAYFDNLREAKAQVSYICRDDAKAVYREQFSFQGFRYAMLEGWESLPSKEDFVACVMHSDMEETGHFSCSNLLLNQLEHNIEWGLRGNFLDIPTDCPQRDERMGWTGDAQIFCRTASFLRNTWPFFSKWLKDVAYDQTPEGGVPHMVPDLMPFHKITDWLLGQGTHSAAAWADVAVINPWTLYLTYGDKKILEQQFTSMKKWIDFMREHAVDDIWNYKLQFGDWVALDAEEGSYFGATPNDLTCTAYYAYSTGLFVKTCRALGKMEEADKYQAQYDRIVKKFQQTFLDETGVMKVQTQTAHILALYFDLLPESGKAGTIEGLKRLLAKENGHLVTGFVGTPYFCHALSQNGCVKEAYDLLLKEDFPSWLYQVKAGATTVWEHWDGIKPDHTMWSPDMNSFNHYAYGAIGEWMYRVIAGIEIDEKAPGYRHILFAPKTGGNLTWAQGSYESVYGTVAIRWEEKDGRIFVTIRIPVNTTAKLTLEESATEPEGDIVMQRGEDGLLSTEIGSGTWTVSYKK